MKRLSLRFWLSSCGVYTKNILLGIDQFLNTVWGGNPDETVSSRIGRIKLKNGGVVPKYRPVVWLLDKSLDTLDPNHSVDAIEWDEDPCDGMFDK